jgi:SagB-type dehydrogenase family enzyme
MAENTHEIPLEPVRRARDTGALDFLLTQRRSSRSFGSQPLSLAHLAFVAWAAQGRTNGGRRVCPSAHALYPLTLTVVAGNVDGLLAGAYTYEADRHLLVFVVAGDQRDAVARTTLADHDWLCRAAALLLLSGDLDAANEHFADQPPRGRRGQRYVWLEAGHASQNVYLRAAEAGLGVVLVAGFDDDQLLDLTPAIVPSGDHPLALLGIGHPAR